MIASVIYLLSWVFLGGGFLLYRKSMEKQQLFCWFPVSFLCVLCMDALFAAVMGFLHVPVSCLSIGIANLAVSVFFWYGILKKGRRQQYTSRILDFIFAAVLFAAVFWCAYRQFGSEFSIRYLTIDPSVHLGYAMDIVNNQSVSGMFFAQLNNAMFIQTFLPFLPSGFDAYKLFMIGDACMLYLSGLMFYALVLRFCKTKFLHITGICLTLLYTLGYPLNNMLYGFIYLGVGVTVTAFLVFGAEHFLADKIDRKLSVLMLGLGMLALMLCYILFVPVVMLGVFLCLTIGLARKKELLKRRTLLDYAVIFLVPIILGLIYSYANYFGEATGTTVGGAIALEGAIYRSLLSNFIIFMPFAVYAVLKMWKEKKNAPATAIFVLLLIFMAGMLFLGIKGKVSSYYFYKNYYLLSLFYYYLAFYGICRLAEKSVRYLAAYFGVWIVLGGVAFTNLEARINSVNPLFATDVTVNDFFDIYLANKAFLDTGEGMETERIALYRYAAENLDGSYIPNVDSYESRYWFESLTNRRVTEQQALLRKEQPGVWVESLLENKEIKYLLVIPASETASPYLAQFEQMPRVYENGFGYIVEKTW